MNQVSGVGDAPHPPRCRDAAPPAPDIPSPCINCEGVCGSEFAGAVCGCDGCPTCAHLANLLLRKWLRGDQ